MSKLMLGKVGETIRVISLWQPWATLLVHGEKKIETRSWQWPGDLPEIIAIHAAKKWNKDLLFMSSREPFKSALARHGFELASDRVSRQNLSPFFGSIVGVGRLVECVSTVNAASGAIPCLANKYLREFENERSFGDYGPGRYAWAFDRFLPFGRSSRLGTPRDDGRDGRKSDLRKSRKNLKIFLATLK